MQAIKHIEHLLFHVYCFIVVYNVVIFDADVTLFEFNECKFQLKNLPHALDALAFWWDQTGFLSKQEGKYPFRLPNYRPISSPG